MTGAPDVLQRLGRPGFPKGMVVLLVGGAEQELVKIEKQMNKLCYQGETAAYSLSRVQSARSKEAAPEDMPKRL